MKTLTNKWYKKMNKQDLLTQLNNESFLISEIKNIVVNNLYFHSINGYNTNITNFVFIDIDNRMFNINVYYSSYSINQIRDMIVKKYNLSISNDFNLIDYTTKVNTKKQLINSVYEFINASDLL